MFRKTLPIALVLVVLLFVFIPIADVFAQAFPGGPSGLVPCVGPECQACHLTVLAQNIINFLVYFAVFVGTLMFAYAGFTYVTAGSNMEKIQKAHDVFWRVFIGIVVVLSAWLVVDLIMTTFLNKSFGPWNKIDCVKAKVISAPLPIDKPLEIEAVVPLPEPRVDGDKIYELIRRKDSCVFKHGYTKKGELSVEMCILNGAEKYRMSEYLCCFYEKTPVLPPIFDDAA